VSRRSQVLERADGGLWFLFARPLVSPNRWLWTSWRAKHREARAWRDLVLATLLDGLGTPRTLELLKRGSIPGAAGAGCQRRMRIWITRIGPRRTWIQDRDNLTFAAKFLVDALATYGLVYDDDDTWTDRPVPLQLRGREAWTVVYLEPLEANV
jgi:hypothetical protein